MTVPELADVLAAQRAAYRPDRIPPFSDLVQRRRRRDRRRKGGLVLATLGAVVAVVGLGLVVPTLGEDKAVQDQVAEGSQTAQPNEQRLRQAFASLTPPITFGAVQEIRAGDSGLGNRPRQQGPGLTAQTSDGSTVVAWSVVSPALTDAEAKAVAGTVEGSGSDQGVLVDDPNGQPGAIKSVAYRFDNGSFIRIWAWSTDGGVATITSGMGASTTDQQVADWQRVAESLLTD